MKRYFDTVLNRAGVVIEGAEIHVIDSLGGDAQLYSDNGVSTTTNPVSSDENGLFSFYVADGTYTLEISYSGEQIDLIEVEIYDDSEDRALTARSLRVPSDEAGLVIPSSSARADKILTFSGDGSASASSAEDVVGPEIEGNIGYNSTGASAVTNFLATTTTTTANAPNTSQKPLLVPPGETDGGTNATIAATGAGQVVYGSGANSQLLETSLRWQNFSYGGAHDLYLRSPSDYGVDLVATGSDRVSWAQFSNLTIRDKTIAGVRITGPSSTGVANNSFANIHSVSNELALLIEYGANLDFVNFNGTACNSGAFVHGVGELKMANSRFQGALDGPNLHILGDSTRSSLESYFTACNFNHGSATDDVSITQVEPYDSGNKLLVTCATAHECLEGWVQFRLTSASYGTASRWYVDEVLSDTELVLGPISGVSPAGPYAATEAGTFNRQHPGLYLEGEVTVSAAYLNDLYFHNGSVNNLKVENLFNSVFSMRTGFAKERAFFDGQNNMVLAMGTFRGRNNDTYSDVLPGGPGSIEGVHMLGAFNLTGTLAPGGQHTGSVAPMSAWGLAANQRPVGYAFSLTGEDGHKIGLGPHPFLSVAKYWHWKASSSSAHMYVDATNGAKMTSDGRDVGVEIVGATAGNRSIIQPFSIAADTNVSMLLRARGTGRVDIAGSTNTQIKVSDTGLAFYNASPVAQPTGVAVDIAAVHAALVTLNLITGP